MAGEFSIAPKPHEEAAALIAGKPAVSRQVFDALLPELRARAFTITGIEDADVLQRVRDAIAELPRGSRWDDVKDEVASELDPWLGDGSEKRAELLLRTQAFTSFQASGWNVAQADNDTTHLQYLTMEDDRVRDSHAALDGLILPKDDPFWDDHYPPWEWNCRCLTRAMNPDQVDTERANDEQRNPDDQLVLEGPALEKLRQGHLIRDGQAYDVSPDPGGFHWNPGDLRIPLDELKKRYDPVAWAAFEDYAKRTEVEAGTSILEWLGGKKLESELALEPVQFESAREAAAWGDENMPPQELSLTKKQREGLADYQSSSIDLNAAIRKRTWTPAQKSQARVIDNVFKKSTAPNSLIVWHGSESMLWSKVQPGSTVQFLNYLSTSLGENMDAFMQTAWIKIKVPRGAPAIYMNDLDGSHRYEAEILLSRRSKLRINTVEFRDGIAYIEADLMP